MKKIPYGIFNYEDLITSGYVYVDKTMYLEKLESIKKTLVYLRPGRFGKSLFTSMMFYYYDINSKKKFENLFKDTYVYDNPTSNKNSYYILKFDFSGISTYNTDNNGLEGKFKTCVITGINNFLNYYQIDYKINESNDSSEILKLFLSAVKGLNLKHKLYILIDEYDNFTNAILHGDTKDFFGVVGDDGFVKSFYACIKEYIGLGLVERFFATGICPVTLNSMTTGFNIATDISTNPRFNSMIGLTHDEVKNLLNEYDKNIQEKIYTIMVKNYDGYLFSSDLPDDRVFNATLVMYLLSYYEELHKIPDNVVDNNITVNYEKIENLLKLQENKFYIETIDEILKTDKITASLKTKFNLLEDFSRDDIISLLYYFGYLTIGHVNATGSITFKVPNYVMKETYGNYFIKILNDYDVVLDTNISDRYLNEIIFEGKIDNITNYVSEVLKLTDNRIFMQFNEKYIQALFFALLVNNSRFNIYTEYPCISGGYIDVMMLPKDEIMKYKIMVEFKYIKKKEYSKSLLEKLKSEGINQLKEYSKDDRINKNLKKYLVIYVGCDVKVMEEIE